MTDVPSAGWREVYEWCGVDVPPYRATGGELKRWWPEAVEVAAVGSPEVRRRG